MTMPSLVRTPVNQSTTFRGQRQAVVTSLGVPWISVVDGSTAYLYYWDDDAWVYSGATASAPGQSTALAIDPIDNGVMWWACLSSNVATLRRLDLSANHKSVTEGASYTVANAGSAIGGFDMVVTPNPSGGGRKLHVVWGRYYSSTSTFLFAAENCLWDLRQGHQHFAGWKCPSCTSSNCSGFLNHDHDGYGPHEHVAYCGGGTLANQCTGTTTDYFDYWYYERWPINAAGVVGTREAIDTIGSASGANNITYLKAVLDWNHSGDGATPTGNVEVYMAYMEVGGSSSTAIKFRKITADGAGTWAAIGAEQSANFSASVLCQSVTGAYVGGKFYVAGLASTTGQAPKALSWDGAITWAVIDPPADSAFGNIRGIVLSADPSGNLHTYVAHWLQSAQVTVREAVWDGAWAAWETVGQAVSNIASTPSIYNILTVTKHRRYGSVWGVVHYDASTYRASGLAVPALMIFGGGWGIAI